MVTDEAFEISQLFGGESQVVGERNRREPELRRTVVSVHMNMRRVAEIMAVEV